MAKGVEGIRRSLRDRFIDTRLMLFGGVCLATEGED